MTSTNQNKVYLVTGATGAIGKAIARQIASLPNSEVVLVCRNQQKAEQAVTEIRHATKNDKVRFELADLSRQADILRLRENWSGRLHGLINNAAVTPRQRLETAEGIEMQFATNVLGSLVNTSIYRHSKSLSTRKNCQCCQLLGRRFESR